VTKTRSVYWDPDGTRYGIPTFPWQCAPAGLATRRQLAVKGLRPGGQPVVAQVMWRAAATRGATGVAYLYRLDLAKPKRVPTAAQLAALEKAMRARRTCPVCGRDAGYVLPRDWDMCPDCDERRETVRAARFRQQREAHAEAMNVTAWDYATAGQVWL
jgi:hypothetical protein